MNRLAILGASGHGKVVADCAFAAGWQVVEFFDDAYPAKAQVGIWSISGTASDLLTRLKEFDGVIVGIGHNMTRWQKHLLLKQAGAPLVSIIHPRAWVSPFARIGPGTVVVAGAVINVDAVIGEACIINTSAVVDHDCVLADAVHISPSAALSGAVAVGARSWVGVGACVRQCIQIGADVTLGAGAVAIDRISDGITAVGCPAAPLHENRLER